MKSVPVTQEDFSALMGQPFGSAGCPTCPVEQVSFVDAARCNELSSRDGYDSCYEIDGDR